MVCPTLNLYDLLFKWVPNYKSKSSKKRSNFLENQLLIFLGKRQKRQPEIFIRSNVLCFLKKKHSKFKYSITSLEKLINTLKFLIKNYFKLLYQKIFQKKYFTTMCFWFFKNCLCNKRLFDKNFVYLILYCHLYSFYSTVQGIKLFVYLTIIRSQQDKNALNKENCANRFLFFLDILAIEECMQKNIWKYFLEIKCFIMLQERNLIKHV